jgi:hypothetical protein
MPFIQSIETARAERIGAEGIAAATLDDALRRGAGPAGGRGGQGAGEAVLERRLTSGSSSVRPALNWPA